MLDEYEYLEDLPLEIEKRYARGVVVGPGEAGEFYQRMELAAAETQLNRVRQELSSAAAGVSAARVYWQAKGWDGYAAGNGPDSGER